MSKILMVISGADRLAMADGSTHPTGYWAEEVAASHEVLTAGGADVEVATPGGVRPTADELSFDERGGVSEEDAQKFRAYLDEIADQLSAPRSLAHVQAADYDAIYIPGGHGPMADLVSDKDLGRLLNEAVDGGKTVVALCHGVAALLSAETPDGEFTFDGRTLTAFSDEEERQGGLADNIPFSVEGRLRDSGARVTPGAPWSTTVIQDGNLITGQNPQSSVATALKTLETLAAR